MSILLKNCKYVVTQNAQREILKDADIFIDGNKISAVGKNLSQGADETIDCSNFAAMPGLINGHTHASMSLLRSYADDMELFAWLEKVWDKENKFTREQVKIGTEFACLEMIKTGTTAFLDMYSHEDAIAEVRDKSGLRAVLSAVVADEDKTERPTSIEDVKKFINTWNNKELITPAIGTHSVYTCNEELLKKSKELADEHNVLLHIHAAETKKEQDDCMKAHGKRVFEYLNSIGFLDGNVVAAHCVWLDDNEFKILKEKNVHVVHNPISNAKLGSGIAPVPKLLSSGINVALGTDSNVSNNSLDMFGEMKFCALIHKINNATTMPAQKVLDMATLNGAKALGLDAGPIENGKLADIILLDLKQAEMQPVHNLISNSVYSANGSCVDTTIVNGKILMKNRKVLTLNETEILDKVEEYAETV